MKIQSAKAGIGTGRAGLQAASGLFSSAGLFNKGVKSFHPNDLDPYLLFDAQTSMIGTLENPTLDLDPSKQDTLDVITATRAGTATYTDFNGLIASASPNTVRVDQTQGAELTPTKFQNIGYTDFSSGRVLSNFGTGVSPVLSSDALGSPNGTEDAYKIVFNAGSGTTSGDGSELYFNVSEIEDNIQSTASIFLRGENGGEQLVFRGASNGSYQLVTLTTEWQRFTTTENTSPSGNQKFTFGIRQSVSGHGVINSAATVYAYGPQLEEGTTASDFVENTTGSPKFITGATFGPRVPMILVEPSATNLVTYSEDFGNSLYTKRNSTVTSGFSSPDGENNAFKLTATANEGDVYFVLGGGGGTTKAVSVFAKAASATSELIIQELGYTGRSTKFNLNSGAITFSNSAGTSTIENFGNGWFKCTHIETYSSGQNTLAYAYRSTTVDSLYLFGAQVETGSVSTSYIPTLSGSTVQRAADDLVISGSDFDFYNQSEGTIYAEFVPKLESLDATLFNFSDGSNFNRIMSLTKFYHIFVTTSGNTQVQFASGSVSLNNLNRLAASFKTNDCVLSLNGSSEVVDSSMAMPSINQINIGARFGGTEHLQGHIRRLIYWPVSSDSL